MRAALPFFFVASSIAACSSSNGTTNGDGGAPFVAHAPSEHEPTPMKCAAHTSNVCGGASDQCTTSADCAPGQGCMCGEEYPGNCAAKPNQCVPAQCIQDSDCGANGYCSPSVTPLCGTSGIDGFYCHSASDTCDDRTDCTSGNASCGWTGSRFECVSAGCAG